MRENKLAAKRESELFAMSRLAAPIVVAEVGWMAMGIVDTMMVGRVGASAIAAVSLGTMLFYFFGICGGGALLGLDTLVARSFGAGDLRDCRRSLINGGWLAMVLMPLIMGAVWVLVPVMARIGIAPDVLGDTAAYTRALNWSTPALLLYFVFRRYLQATNVVAPVTWTLITANLVNLAGNWILVFGHLGAPRMGAEGSGWATCLSRIYMAGVLGWVILRRNRGVRLFEPPDLQRVRALLKLGLPAAGQMAVEIGVFGMVTILVGRLNALSLASHQIALTIVSTTFMIPLGISSAAAVRVGQGLGAGDRHAAARSGWMALALGAGGMSLAGLGLLLAPYSIARSFTPEAAVITGAIPLLRIAAFFQLFDGLQVVATGALRGTGDTRTPMLCHLIGYWVIGLPLGAALCFWRGWGAAGLWTGLSVALILIGSLLAYLWRRRTRDWAVLQ